MDASRLANEFEFHMFQARVSAYRAVFWLQWLREEETEAHIIQVEHALTAAYHIVNNEMDPKHPFFSKLAKRIHDASEEFNNLKQRFEALWHRPLEPRDGRFSA